MMLLTIWRSGWMGLQPGPKDVMKFLLLVNSCMLTTTTPHPKSTALLGATLVPNPQRCCRLKKKTLSRGGVVEGAEAEADRAMHPQLKTSYLISVLLAHSTCIANLCRFRASMGTVLRLMVDMASVASVAKSFTHTCTAWPARSWHVAHNPMSPARQCLPGRRRRRGRRAAAATR